MRKKLYYNKDFKKVNKKIGIIFWGLKNFRLRKFLNYINSKLKNHENLESFETSFNNTLFVFCFKHFKNILVICKYCI